MSTMANLILLFGREFSTRFPPFWNQEDRIIAKTMFATRCVSNKAFHRPRGETQKTTRLSQGDNASETGGTLFGRTTLQTRKNKTKTFGVRSVHTREAC